MGLFESMYSELRDAIVVVLEDPDVGVDSVFHGVNLLVYR